MRTFIVAQGFDIRKTRGVFLLFLAVVFLTLLAPSSASAQVASFMCPVGGAVIQHGYHNQDYACATGGLHSGVDITSSASQEVRAMAAGTATYIHRDCSDPRSGNLLIIDHGGGVVSKYVHLRDSSDFNSSCVNLVKTVERGEVIASIGDTGIATYFHLHFIVEQDGVKVNPLTAICDPAFGGATCVGNGNSCGLSANRCTCDILPCPAFDATAFTPLPPSPGGEGTLSLGPIRLNVGYPTIPYPRGGQMEALTWPNG